MENNKLFVYGILQRGYELDLSDYGAKFLGEAHIEGATLYGIGPIVGGNEHEYRYSGVGLRLDGKNTANGELWEVPADLWAWLDDCEQNGFCYTRKIVEVQLEWEDGTASNTPFLMKEPVQAWVYEHTYPNFKYENPLKGGRF